MVFRFGSATEWKLIFTRICAGVVLKFMLGSDDLVWLSPFMAKARSVREKTNIGTKYVLSVLFLTMLACALAVLIHLAAKTGNGDDLADEIIATIAAGLLLAYAIYMAWDEGYFNAITGAVSPDEEEKKQGYGTLEPEEEEEEEELGYIKTAVKDALVAMSDVYDTYCSCVDADTRELARDLDDDDDHDTSVVVVAFLGSMDDFMVYFTLALSSQLTWFELTVGVTIGAILIALIVGVLLQSSETLANAVEVIPVPLILAGLAAFILVTAWTSFDGL